MRIGFGYDSHSLVPGRALVLGGVQIPSTLGPEAHSDGDALIHALIDALLGVCALGDIGQLFPSSDEQYREISSRVLLQRTLADLGIPVAAISVKAKTKEGMGLTGRGRAVEAYAVALVEEP